MNTKQLQSLANDIRRSVLTMTTAAGSGHPSSCLSAADLMTTLMFGGTFRADLKQPGNPANDRIVFSKGHAAPLLYALYAAAGAIRPAELQTLRKRGSRLAGHPMPVFPYTEAPTGSLGQGLSIGLGIAEANALVDSPARTFVLLGDGELAEGSVWEAVALASHRRRNSLIAVVDVNGLGQTGPTMLRQDGKTIAKRFSSFGWETEVIDGHDFGAIKNAYTRIGRTRKPLAIIAGTIKGKGVTLMEGKQGWHGRPLPKAVLSDALAQLPVGKYPRPRFARPLAFRAKKAVRTSADAIRYPFDSQVSPRQGVGNAFARLSGSYPNLVVLDGDVNNSTFTNAFAKTTPHRFIEGFIAEQNLAGMANGLAARGWLPVVATFGAFLTRAYDQLRMAGYAGTQQLFIGTHPGVSVGQDGPSQMALEDVAMFRAIGATVLCPADAVAAERVVESALKQPGLTYIRAGRGAVQKLYAVGQRFPVGGSMVLRQSRRDQVTIIGCGVTVFEALEAANRLLDHGITVRVIDCYSIQPIDERSIRQAARATQGIVVVEDHRPAGGLADAVREALQQHPVPIVSLAVRHVPGNGTPEQLRQQAGINATSIVAAVHRIIKL